MKKAVVLITCLTSALACAAMGVLATAAFSNNSSMVQTIAQDIESSVTFQNFTNVSSKASATSSLSQGGLIRAYGTTSASLGDACVNSSGKNCVFFEFLTNTEDNVSINVNDNSRNMAKFQSITGITVTYNGGSGNAYIKSSSNGVSWDSTQVVSGSKIELSNAKFAYIGYDTVNTTNRYIKSIKIEYSCSTFQEATLSSISLSGDYPTNFYVGDTFSTTGLVVTAHYSDSSSSVVNPTSVSNPDMSVVGQQTIEVSYTQGGITANAEYEINISEPEPVDVLTGVYTSAYSNAGINYTLSIDFDNKVYKVDTSNNDHYKIHFTFELDGTTLTFTKDKKNDDTNEESFGRVRMFYDSSENTNVATVNNDGTISVTLSYSFGGKKTHVETFTK